MLSSDFIQATWRGTTNTDGIKIGVSFETEDGKPIRLVLKTDSARHLMESLGDYLDHSDKSLGIPSRDGSPHEGQKV